MTYKKQYTPKYNYVLYKNISIYANNVKTEICNNSIQIKTINIVKQYTIPY